MKLAVLPNLNKPGVYENSLMVLEKLYKLPVEIMVYSKYKKHFNSEVIAFYDDFFGMISLCDMILVIGGDGSIIHAAKHAAVENKPVLGINMGRIGFVAELEINELDKLNRLISNEYTIEKRMMLELELTQNRETKTIYALNDAVISRGSLSKMVELSVSCDNSKISHYRSDGIIVSTPTGSTAYSLSAGGPVMEPKMRAMILTPICAQSLFSRSVVFGDKTALTITSEQEGQFEEICLSIDGEKAIKLYDDFCLKVKPSNREASFVKIKNLNFYNILNEKLSERRI